MGKSKWVVLSFFSIQLLTGGAFARSQQAFMAARARAAQAANQYLSELATNAELSNDSAFSKGETSAVGEYFCTRFAQTAKGQEILGTLALICFSPDGSTIEKSAQLCEKDCL